MRETKCHIKIDEIKRKLLNQTDGGKDLTEGMYDNIILMLVTLRMQEHKSNKKYSEQDSQMCDDCIKIIREYVKQSIWVRDSIEESLLPCSCLDLPHIQIAKENGLNVESEVGRNFMQRMSNLGLFDSSERNQISLG